MPGLIVVLFCLLNALLVKEASSHGRLIEPPSRASMWRYGFDTPHDYNDHECYCGGFTRQWQRNKGNCGICGDAWDSPEPRAHEAGGKYGTGVIVRKYRTGSVIPVHVELTANHHGYFEFRTCAMRYRNKEVTQECLDQHVLAGANGTARYYPGPGNQVFKAFYKLPEQLTCAQCVFQWRYIAGNNWGDCGNGTGAVGCGPQEEFRACADISIGDEYLEPLPPPEYPDDNRLPGDEDVESSESSQDAKRAPYWLLSVIIASTCLLIVIAALALLYSYYYHAGKAKKWLMAKWYVAHDNQQPPIAPPRHRKQCLSNLSLQPQKEQHFITN